MLPTHVSDDEVAPAPPLFLRDSSPLFPILPTRQCRWLASAFGAFLRYGVWILALITGWLGSLVMGVVVVLVGVIVMGIIRSKLRYGSVPDSEYDYTDKMIAMWYVARWYCRSE